MSDLEPSPEIRSRRLPGTRRLGLLALYFWLGGLFAALFALIIALTDYPTGPNERWIVSLGLALSAFGGLRAARLLRRRRRAGAQLAAACLAMSIAVSARARGLGLDTLAVYLFGIGLLASVWPHLE